MNWEKELLIVKNHIKSGHTIKAKILLEDLIKSENIHCFRESKILLAGMIESSDPDLSLKYLEEAFVIEKNFQTALQLIRISAKVKNEDSVLKYYNEAMSLMKDSSLSKTMNLNMLVLDSLVDNNLNVSLREELILIITQGCRGVESLDYHFLTVRQIPDFLLFLNLVKAHYKMQDEKGFDHFLDRLSVWVDSSGNDLIIKVLDNS